MIMSNAPKEPMTPEQITSVAKLFSVLSEPSRLVILQKLMVGETCVGDLVHSLDMKQANVSKQLALLYDAKLVTRRRNGNTIFYSICDPVVFDLCSTVCGKIRNDARTVAQTLGA